MAQPRRQRRSRIINPTFYVFCEGKTEENYINFLKQQYRVPSVSVDARIKGLNISNNYIKNYKQGKETHARDRDFLFYDLDKPSVLERLRSINNATLLISNPSVEIWFLYHFKEQKAHITSVACVRELRNLNGQYRKSLLDNNLKERLSNYSAIALKNANMSESPLNPSSTVNVLVQLLEELSNNN